MAPKPAGIRRKWPASMDEASELQAGDAATEEGEGEVAHRRAEAVVERFGVLRRAPRRRGPVIPEYDVHRVADPHTVVAEAAIPAAEEVDHPLRPPELDRPHRVLECRHRDAVDHVIPFTDRRPEHPLHAVRRDP